MIYYYTFAEDSGYRLFEGSLGPARVPSEDDDEDEVVAPGHHTRDYAN